MRFSSFVVASSVLLAGCIWQPASGTEKENSASISVSGWATAQNTAIDIKVRNWDTGAFDPITSTTSSTYDLFGDGMYSWAATLTTAMLPRKYWVPTAVTGNPAGRLEIAGFQDGEEMYTFTKAAQSCAIDEMDAGETQPDAGLACSDGFTTVLFDNTGYDRDPEPLEYTTHVDKTVSGVNVKVISYASQGNTVHAAVCSPLAGTGLPVAIYNHGGGLGINPAPPPGVPDTFPETTWCVDWAAKGWVYAMSTYRGEAIRVPSTWSVSPTSWTSSGSVETNLGEVNDSMRLTAIVQNMSHTDDNRTFMYGLSHGGGITLRAVERGVKVNAAAAMYPATDWVQLYNDCKATTMGAPMSDVGMFCATVTAALEAQTGGTPTTKLAAYNWRSPTFFSADLKMRKDVKILVQQGVPDPIVRVSQTCNFSTQAGFPATTRWHVPDNLTPGSFTTAAVTGCPSWVNGSRPTTSWPENRYFLVYDGVEHVPVGALVVDFFRFVNSLAWTASPWPT